jgi:hypothetical protein
MKKLLWLAGILLAITLLSSSFLSYNFQDEFSTYSEKGWPVAYQKTINNHGLCRGYTNAVGGSGGTCDITDFPTNKYAMELDVLFWLVISLALSFIITKFSTKKSQKAI